MYSVKNILVFKIRGKIMKKKILTLLMCCVVLFALTACGTKGSYTNGGVRGGAAVGDNTTGQTEDLPPETDKQTDATEPTEPETEYNGKYWKVKTSDWEGTVDWVKVREFEGKLYIEYDGKEVTVPWATQEIEPGCGGSFYVQDVTGDGYEDLIAAMSIREIHVFFVYDLKNGKDLSPYYCKNLDLYDGLYTYEEYASPINQALKPVLEPDSPLDVSSLSVVELSCHAIRGENDFFENGVLTFRYGNSGLSWHCTVEFDFTGGECKMKILEARTQYSRLKEIFDVHGEYIIDAEVALSGNKVVAANEDIEITVTSNYFVGDGDVIIKYKDWDSEKTVEDWDFDYDSDKVYFELYDYDNDGTDELLYHTVMDGEDKVQVYEFEQ